MWIKAVYLLFASSSSFCIRSELTLFKFSFSVINACSSFSSRGTHSAAFFNITTLGALSFDSNSGTTARRQSNFRFSSSRRFLSRSLCETRPCGPKFRVRPEEQSSVSEEFGEPLQDEELGVMFVRFDLSVVWSTRFSVEDSACFCFGRSGTPTTSISSSLKNQIKLLSKNPFRMRQLTAI